MKKLSKSELKFNRDKKKEIEYQSRQKGNNFTFLYNNSEPIYIPKKKYKK